TFDYEKIMGTVLPPRTSFWLFLGFFAAFAVKLPVVPVHNWLPDAHTEAPTAGSVILAGLLLKTGAFGMIRFAIPLFPAGAAQATPIVMGLAVAGILYGAVMAFAQRDLKRLVAYSSISHMGFVLLGIFAWNTMALEGAMMQMICHGIGTGALLRARVARPAGARQLRRRIPDPDGRVSRPSDRDRPRGNRTRPRERLLPLDRAESVPRPEHAPARYPRSCSARGRGYGGVDGRASLAWHVSFAGVESG
ncbi:MAG: proton-conducting transporter membrane subunit, partial [Candidatus Hydrogenedentes bacterium]|nr:proton-conducting transporter membrane subunit [Candidatus Hydrogenedentota bacterium]